MEYSTINLELNRRRKECLDKFAIERANKLHAAYLKELKLDDDSTSISNPIRYRESNSRGMVRKEWYLCYDSIAEINLGCSVQIALVISGEEDEKLWFIPSYSSLFPPFPHPRSNACLTSDGFALRTISDCRGWSSKWTHGCSTRTLAEIHEIDPGRCRRATVHSWKGRMLLRSIRREKSCKSFLMNLGFHFDRLQFVFWMQTCWKICFFLWCTFIFVSGLNYRLDPIV